MIRWILAVALLAEAVPAGAAVAVRVLLGVGDQEETDWSGGVTARGASIVTTAASRNGGRDNTITRDRDRRRALVRRPKKYFLAKKLNAPDATPEAPAPSAPG